MIDNMYRKLMQIDNLKVWARNSIRDDIKKHKEGMFKKLEALEEFGKSIIGAFSEILKMKVTDKIEKYDEILVQI